MEQTNPYPPSPFPVDGRKGGRGDSPLRVRGGAGGGVNALVRKVSYTVTLLKGAAGLRPYRLR